ncbi:S8 family serine peptidase [Pseudomonas sp. GCM10022188]|uniref:S8 family serine peptidase n=1 Tax=Pseudomonas TaxID=286 RepID=UPI001E3815DF|nr:S8 family serine peptidase [Pseudomonas oryzagri]MCC6075501.1 S8 family serine peptidase [Pseudomonas oryzagri]
MNPLRTLSIVLALLLGASNLFAAPPAPAQLDLPRYAPDRVLVKFKPGTAASEIAADHRNARATLLRELPEIGVQVMQVPTGTVEASIAAYRGNPNVLYAEPDYYRLLRIPREEPGPTLAGGADYFAEQWYLHNSGQNHMFVNQTILGASLEVTSGTPNADINAPEAWDLSIGKSGDLTAYDKPKVAVLDSGADCSIPDLLGKCLEQVNLVGAAPGSGLDTCAANAPACDNYGHGTFVAGEAVANTNNSEGVAGVGWNTGAGIFKVCYLELVTDGFFLYEVGLCPVSGSSTAILQASADQYANGNLVRSQYQVITMSYASDLIDPVSGEITQTDASSAECEAIAVARDRGVLVIAAAGNNGDTTRTYPAACTDAQGKSTVLSVAASNHEDDRASFSTYSRATDHWVSLAAPGQDIIGILPSANCGLPDASDSCVDWWSGTSMAAPLVAGAAALVWDDLYTRLPSGASRAAASCRYADMPCNHAVRLRLEQNAAKVGANAQNLLSWTANGRLDLAAALRNDISTTGGGGTPPVAAFSYSCMGLVCAFTAAGSGEGTLSYRWQWGDSSADGAGTAPGHTYAATGIYTVTQTITTANGSAAVSASLNLKAGKRTVSGSVSSATGGSGGGGGCSHPKGKC